MSVKDKAGALDRVAPSDAAGASGKFTFTSAASAYQAIRTGTSGLMPPVYISFKVTADCHVAFGGSGVTDPTNSFPLFQSTDGWQDFELTPQMTGFKVKGDSGGGDLYWFISGL